MDIQDFLDQLLQSGGGSAASSGGGGGAASISGSGLSSLLDGGGVGSGLGGLLGGLFGGNPGSGSAGMGGELGTLGGTLLTPFLGPLGPIAGGFLGDLIGSLIGGGVPREAKTSALGGALQSSGNPLDALVGNFISNGANDGRVLSESNSNTFGQSSYDLAAFLSALTGQQEPNVTASGFEHNPTFTAPGLGKAGTNFQIPAGYNFLDPSKAADAAKIIQQIVGMQQPAGNMGAAKSDWQKVVQDLISRGDLTKYKGTLGAPGAGGPTGPGGNPNISLPHPLAQQPAQATISPYPLTPQGYGA